MIISSPDAFDAFAADYDDLFTNSTLGRLLRPRIWKRLAEHFSAGEHILELACGTGEDAVWLAQQGCHVTATDGSAGMVEQAKAKADAEMETSGQVDVIQVSLQQIINRQSSIVNRQFDGVFSNFGGLNTIDDFQSLAKNLAKVVKPGGKVILVPMGPVCPWEILWYVAHAQPRIAFRRFRGSVSAKIGEVVIPIWYPSAKQLRADLTPWFKHLHTESLGLWLPPSYLGHFVERWPNLFEKLNRFERSTAHLTKGWGDHYIIIFERVE